MVRDYEAEWGQHLKIEERLRTASIQEILEIVSEVALANSNSIHPLNPHWVEAQMKLALERLKNPIESTGEPSSDRYFVQLPEKEVTKEEFINAERNAGFHSKFGALEPATGGFVGSNGVSGRVESAPRNKVES